MAKAMNTLYLGRLLLHRTHFKGGKNEVFQKAHDWNRFVYWIFSSSQTWAWASQTSYNDRLYLKEHNAGI